MDKMIQDLFSENDGLTPDIDGLQLVDIDLEGIDESAKKDAVALIDNLSKFYYDEDFMRRHPTFKKRVDTDLESLRILFKMRKTDEVAHDLLIKAISGNSSNASLYKSLSDIQKTIISVTTKIGNIIDGLNALMKGYQLELNFEPADSPTPQSNDSEEVGNTHRGTKEFIERMNAKLEQEDLFDEADSEKEEEVE